MKYFGLSMGVTIVGLILAFFWGLRIDLSTALEYSALALYLGILEVSLSFDNAVINATKLELMPKIWQRRFLTWGILVAVFGMRLVFPILIVSAFAGINIIDTVNLALFNSAQYSHHLEQCGPMISAFGGMFLYMIFLTFIFDKEKDCHWVKPIEKFACWCSQNEPKSRVAALCSWPVIISLCTLAAVTQILPGTNYDLGVAGIAGLILFLIIDNLSEWILKGEAKLIQHAGIVLFLYLELIDASFSFDGVIGAFALSRDVVLIAIGLGIGAMFVRSLTIYLVDKKTLKQFIYLEHGAHWAIGTLAIIMFLDTMVKVPEIVTGLIGAGFIGISVLSSLKHKETSLS